MHRSAPLTRTLLPYRTPTLLGMLQRKSGKTLCLPLCSNNPLPSRRLRRTLCVSRSCRKEQGSHCTRNRTRKIRRSARSGIERLMTKEERNAVVLRTMTEKEGERDTRAGLTPGLRPDMTGTTTRANAITADRVLHLPVDGTRTGPQLPRLLPEKQNAQLVWQPCQ